MKYPKIQTLWKRDEQTHKIIEGDYSKTEFENILLWDITEKIDGTNIRIEFVRKDEELYDGATWQTPYVNFKGREENTEKDIPKPLLEYLQRMFKKEILKEIFTDTTQVILFGEGYGKNIQTIGKRYSDDVSFILFDVYIDGWWLERKNIKDIADKLGIKVVPSLGIMFKHEVIKLVKKGIPSLIAKESIDAEGIVARSHPQMLFRDKTPIMWKLKSKDYR